MNHWAFYFMAKYFLHWRGLVEANFFANLVLFAAATLPLPPGDGARGRLARWRTPAAAACAAALLWFEFRVPLARPAWSSLLLDAGVLAALLLGARLAALRGLHLGLPIIVSICLCGIQSLGAPSQAVNRRVAQVYEEEARRRVVLPKPEGLPFDIIFLHVSSLAWDDLEAAGVPQHRLLRRFDWLLTDFNTASSYSSSSSLRLLRSLCGQVPHDRLYLPWPPECSLPRELRLRGYRTYTMLNHPAPSEEAGEQLSSLASADKPAGLDGLTPAFVNFDDTPIYGDLATLQRWWAARHASGEPRAALYFNSNTLHSGAHYPVDGWWNKTRAESFIHFLDRLSDDLDAFYAMLEDSGTNAVVILVPEHGLALRGNALQASNERALPLPYITRAPVGVRFISGKATKERRPRLVHRPLSYSSLAHLLAQFLKTPPFGDGRAAAETALSELPASPFVAETQEARVTRVDAEYFLFGKEKRWIRLPPGFDAAPRFSAAP